ncbi:MAG: PD-(D/E)XK nuclease family protein [Anaerolineae bacterium]
MTLPTDFQFSQGSLQDYVDCPRRFQLRYIQRVAWPAVEAEPALENERHLQQGAAFHRLVHQHMLGLSPERLSSTITDEALSRWWHNYLESGPTDLPASRYPEVVLSAPVSGHRLVAKYDLIAVDPALSPSALLRVDSAEGSGRRAIIVDWKTSRKRPRRKWLAERLQTRVYPYLLVRAGAHLNEGRPFQPEQVEMVYWFADFPEDPERFPYDAAQYDADDAYLASLIEEIKELALSPVLPAPSVVEGSPVEGLSKGLGDEGFPLTTQERRCRYCPYRSLCRRGTRAGAFEEAEDEPEWGDDFEIALDFEQIAEIEY